MRSPLRADRIRAISFDVTGTLIQHRRRIAETYVDVAVASGLPDPPSVEQMETAFRAAYRRSSLQMPCFGHAARLPHREWW